MNEAELEAALRPAIEQIFPWLQAGNIRQQVTFTLRLGHAEIEVDGARDYRKHGRADVLIVADRPLAIFELKREGLPLTDNDARQGLSYARLLEPMAPLVVVTNGVKTRIYDTYSGKELDELPGDAAAFETLIANAAQIALGDRRDAINTLMGTDSAVWTAAITTVSSAALDEKTDAGDAPDLPFAAGFSAPRKATKFTRALIAQGHHRLIALQGEPLGGKSTVLAQLVRDVPINGEGAVLYLEGAVGESVFRTIADLFATNLDWPLTADDARHWLRTVARAAQGPRLIIAIDSPTADNATLAGEIAQLSSNAYGNNLAVVIACDDAAFSQLAHLPNRRDRSPIGRRARSVRVGALDDDEFEAVRYQLAQQHVTFVRGAEYAREFRSLWLLRALRANVQAAPEYQQGNLVAALPPLLGLEFFHHARQRFEDPQLLSDFRRLASVVLADANQPTGPHHALTRLATPSLREASLRAEFQAPEIERLESRGYISLATLKEGGGVYIVRLPELLVSQLADLIGSDLANRTRNDADGGAAFLADLATKLPLGPLVAAQGVHDAALRYGGVSLALVTHLLERTPKRQKMQPGMLMMMSLPNGETVPARVLEGSKLAIGEGDDPDIIDMEGDDVTYGDCEPWLILSYLCAYPFTGGKLDIGDRADPMVLLDVGQVAFVLRDYSDGSGHRGVPTHRMPEGELLCHSAGVIEPITLSILRFLSESHGADRDAWINHAVDLDSIYLLMRIQAALTELKQVADPEKSDWARKTLAERVRPAIDARLGPDAHC